MSTNYEKGRRKEYKVIHEARAKGHLAFRSAGSHSPVDVVDIDTSERVIRFVQCKPDSISEKARQKLLDENSQINGVFEVKFEVV